MTRVFDRKMRWRNETHQGMKTVCRVQAFTTNDFGPVIIISDVPINLGPPVARVLERLITLLDGTREELLAVPGYVGFDSAMWYLAQTTPESSEGMSPVDQKVFFYRIREDGDTYKVDHEDWVGQAAMADLLGTSVSVAP